MYVPEVFEGEARGRLRKLYHHIRTTMHVPIVNYLFRVLAHYPSFLRYAMEISRPNLLSPSFERAADELRAVAVPEHVRLQLPAYVTHRDLRGAASILPVFHYVNPKLLLLAAAWYEALSERPPLGRPPQLAAEEGFVPPGIPSRFPKQVPLMRIESAPAHLQHLLKNIVDTHRGFGPASDYRALAHYPTFLSAAWTQIQPHVRSDWYRDASDRLLQQAHALAHTLPHPLLLTPGRLQKTLSEREIASALGIIAMFRHLLPDLILDIELMTRLLAQPVQKGWWITRGT